MSSVGCHRYSGRLFGIAALDGKMSFKMSITRSIVQGSCLGPFLFIIYILDGNYQLLIYCASMITIYRSYAPQHTDITLEEQ